jgi:hypothetical protein
MDTNRNLETKEEAATTADLLQQESQQEVVNVLPPAACSDEEKLAAGISMIGLQTKGPSGVQRKRLTQERKMKEGTWTEKKPPRETTSTQCKDGAGSSGVAKRPHSDSSTPPAGGTANKKPRDAQVQTRTHKDAVVGIKMVIIHRHYPEVKLDQTQVDMIQNKLLIAVDANPQGETPPQFLYSKFTLGILQVTCVNESSKAWLMWVIGGLGGLW